MNGALPLLPLYAFMAWKGKILLLQVKEILRHRILWLVSVKVIQ
jgi:hypothetical protein